LAVPVLTPGLKTLLSKLTAFAADVFGEPLNADQAEAFIFLLFVIGFGVSVLMVGVAYVYFWLADLRKKHKEKAAAGGPVLEGQRILCEGRGLSEGRKM
jgi:hypothetical protein